MSAVRPGDGLADGQWHRLHPATPLLRGGVVVLALLAGVLASFREQAVQWLFPNSYCDEDDEFCAPGDPIVGLTESGLLPLALLIVAGVLILLVIGFWLSWRMHSYRITDELVEVRSGILFRTHRQGRLDRIQGINVTRPLLARIFGAAKLEVTVAGQDANVQLAYLAGAQADALRAEILRLASGARQDATPVEAPPDPVARFDAIPAPAPESLVERRLSELVAPELDPSLAAPESIVEMPPGRLLASTVLSGAALWVVIPVAVIVAGIVVNETTGSQLALPIFAGALIPAIIGGGSYLVNRVVKSLRFTIAGTPDGIRIGYGLLSTSNETLPPGRIHSISLSQPLMWRGFDWWEVKVNRAGTSSADAAAGRQNTTILPVGTRADAYRVLELVLPALQEEGLRSRLAAGLAAGIPDDGYTTSPRRARGLRWFSWRRNGFLVHDDAVLLRRGAIWRELVIVPTARLQSVDIQQGPLLRSLRLASIMPHTVAGPVGTRIGAIDVRDAERFFVETAAVGVRAAAADRSQRWGEAPG